MQPNLRGGGRHSAAVYLTNALTGWLSEEVEPPLPIREFETEREHARRVKQKLPILVILGNPPYNAFANEDGSENDLTAPYTIGLRKEWNIGNPQILSDLYVKFIRVAERRIDELGKGIVCYISNYSYVSGESFPVMRQHLMQSFDKIWIDSLNGDQRRTGYKTPEGEPDPSVFKTRYNPGIKVGTAVGLFVKKSAQRGHCEVRFRDLWGEDKRRQLLESADIVPFDDQYEVTEQAVWNRFMFAPSEEDATYLSWPSITDLTQSGHVTGVVERRGGALIDIDREALEDRMRVYFDNSISWDEFSNLDHKMNVVRKAYDVRRTREKALGNESFDPGNFARLLKAPFDVRWAYHARTTGVWSRKQDGFRAHMRHGDGFVATRRARIVSQEGYPVFFTRCLGDHGMARGQSCYFPLKARVIEKPGDPDWIDADATANLSSATRDWLAGLGLENPDENEKIGDLPWLHALAISWSPKYLSDNNGNLGVGWPRIPMPADSRIAQSSADLGRIVSDLLDSERDVAGVTEGEIAKHLAVIGRVDGDDLRLISVKADAARDWSASERDALTEGLKEARIETERGLELLGAPIDVALNAGTFWRGIPERVWDCRVGGYRPLSRWINQRKKLKKGQPLKAREADEIAGIMRRIAALLLMTDSLDANYEACRDNACQWPLS